MDALLRQLTDDAVAFVQDFDDRLQRKDRILEVLMDMLHCGVIIHEHGKILMVNRAFCEFAGCEPADLLGHDCREFIDEESRRMMEAAMERGSDGSCTEYDTMYTVGEARQRKQVHIIGKTVPMNGHTCRITIFMTRDLDAQH